MHVLFHIVISRVIETTWWRGILHFLMSYIRESELGIAVPLWCHNTLLWRFVLRKELGGYGVWMWWLTLVLFLHRLRPVYGLFHQSPNRENKRIEKLKGNTIFRWGREVTLRNLRWLLRISSFFWNMMYFSEVKRPGFENIPRSIGSLWSTTRAIVRFKVL